MRHRYNKSFTLLEAVITIGILGVLIVLVFRSFTVSLRAAKLAGDMTFACFAAQEKFWEIEQKVKNNIALPASGKETLDVYNKQLIWHYEISDTSDVFLKEARAGISWNEKQDIPNTVNLTTYIAVEK